MNMKYKVPKNLLTMKKQRTMTVGEVMDALEKFDRNMPAFCLPDGWVTNIEICDGYGDSDEIKEKGVGIKRML